MPSLCQHSVYKKAQFEMYHVSKIHQSAATLTPSGGINNVLLDRDQNGKKKVMLTMIDRCQNTWRITDLCVCGCAHADLSATTLKPPDGVNVAAYQCVCLIYSIYSNNDGLVKINII